MYADDAVLYSKCTGEDNDTLSMNIQYDLNTVHTWCKNNAIMMNVKKNKTMLFGMRHRLADVDKLGLYANNRLLECVPFYEYLGTYLNSELNFTKQSNDKIKTYLNTSTLVKLYKSYIQPYFDYNDFFLESTTVRQYDKLVRLQGRCLRRCLRENQKVHKKGNLQHYWDQ